MSPAELAASFSDLDEAAFDHVQRLLGSWGVLADLSFSDLLLLVPARGSEARRLLVLGQIRPTTDVTLLRVDLIGQVVTVDDWELAAEAIRTGKVVSGVAKVPVPSRPPDALPAWPVQGDSSDTGEVPVLPETAQFECVPVPLGRGARAVMVRIGPLEDRRRSYRLEKVYRDLYQRLAAMVAAGDYPFASEDVTTEDAPRVGDGLILVDTEGRIAYSSPNAMSALHRMGVTEAVQGRRLPDLGVEETAVDRALAAGCPVIEEVERRPDVIVLVHCTPLLAAGKVTGAMVLLRDVTDLRRLDRLLLSKDAAIREVHHRVKNNLQTISSLLRLQARRLAPGQGQEALFEAERRVRSIAVVHEILSREPGEEVPFDEIVASLVRMAEDSAVSGDGVEIRVTGDIGELDADVATPLAVALAELLQNAVEHAFVTNGADGAGGSGSAARPSGHVDLVLANDGRRLTLQVRDDGVGLPPGFDIEATTSLGLSIVRDLVKTQLGGTIVMESRGGTLVTLDIPAPVPDDGGSWH
jgi:two-component system, sensor histidine kinase PdtaS